MEDGAAITPARVGILAEAAGVQMSKKNHASAAKALAGNRKGVLAKFDLIPQDTAPATVMEPRWGVRP